MKELFRYRELIKNLVIKDLKLKYRDSTIGFLWSLLNPLLLILVYSFVFGHILQPSIPQFSFFLMVGILPWNFFAQSLTTATGAILDNSSMIRTVAVPMEIFPIATVLFALVQHLLALAVFLPMTFFFFQVPFSWALLAFFPLLILHVLFTLGLSFMVAAATVFYRDVRHFVEIFLTLLFWLTPVIYDMRSIPDPLRNVISINPLSFFILSYQDILHRQTFPRLSRLAIVVVLSMASLSLGYLINYRHKNQFAEEV